MDANAGAVLRNRDQSCSLDWRVVLNDQNYDGQRQGVIVTGTRGATQLDEFIEFRN